MAYHNPFRTTEFAPIMVRLVRPVERSERAYSYDDHLGLNVAYVEGKPFPAVLLPESKVWLKTKVAGPGED